MDPLQMDIKGSSQLNSSINLLKAAMAFAKIFLASAVLASLCLRTKAGIYGGGGGGGGYGGGGGHGGGGGGGYGGGGGGGGGGFGTAYSYSRFNGPVADGGVEVSVDKGNGGGYGGGFGGGKYGGGGGGGFGGKAVDYVSAPRYNFEYGVNDGNSGDTHSQSESHDGNRVTGQYSLSEGNGNVRTVRYYTDGQGGFHAEVSNSNGNNHAGGTYGGGGGGGYGGGGGGGKKY